MGSFDIDIIDFATGAKKGSGPIATATSWRNTRRLSKSGEIAFSMPASDPVAAELLAKRIAECHSMRGAPGDRSRVTFGSGIIDKTSYGVEIQGGTDLNVSGSDLLDELTRRSVGDLSTVVIAATTAARVVHNNDPLGASTFTNLTNAYDGNAGTNSTVSLTVDDYLYVAAAAAFDAIRFDVGATPNAISATWTLEYWNGSAWAGVAVGTDGSAASGKVLAQDGDVAFARPPLWASTTVNSYAGFWIRLQPSATLTPLVTLNEVSTVTRTASLTAPADVLALAPAGWSLDGVNGYTTTGTGVYLQFSGENVLAALVKIADAIGEQFRLGVGRTIVWLRDDQPSSGLLAVADGDSSIIDNPDVVIITRLTPTRDTHDLVTRVYPRGAGNGTARLDLGLTTRTAPTGYTFGSDTIGYYISNDAADTAYGRIDHHESFKDIAVLDTDTNTPDPEPSDLINAANQLFDAAVAWLNTHCVELWAYQLDITKCDVALEVGTTIDVQYRKTVDNYREVDIDTIRDGRPLVILQSVPTIDKTGIHTMALTVATAARLPDSEIAYLFESVDNAHSMDTHNQPSSSTGYATTAGAARTADLAGTLTGLQLLTLTGGLWANGIFRLRIASVAGTATIAATNVLVRVTGGGAKTLTLPTAALSGQIILVVDEAQTAGANNITMAAAGGQTLVGSTVLNANGQFWLGYSTGGTTWVGRSF